MDKLKPLSGLTKLLTRMLCIYTFIVGCAVITGIYEWIEYKNFPPNQDITETLLPSEAINLAVGLIQAVIYIALAVIFLKWIYRINANLHSLSSTRMEYSPKGSIGWYFCPIACLFKPYRAMKEIWVVSHRAWAVDSKILGWWWFLWLTSNYISRIAMKLVSKADTLDAYKTSTIVYIVSDGIEIALNIVALMLVVRIAKAYEENYGVQVVRHVDAPESAYQKNLAGS